MGHIQTRERGGKKRYVVRYTGPDGKERTKTFDKLGKPEIPGTAKHFLSETEGRIRQGDWVDPKSQRITVRQLAEPWQSQGAAVNTNRNRRAVVNDLGPLADMWITQVRQSHIRDWLDTLKAGRPWADNRPLAESTASVHFVTLKSLFARAVDDGLLNRNPCASIRQRVVTNGAPLPSDIPTPAQVFALVDGVKDPISTMMLTTASAGLRSSEVAGLRPMDVDFLRKEIHVRQQAAPDSTLPPTSKLKTPTSRRVVPLPSELHDAMSAFLAANKRDRGDLIFQTIRGRPWNSHDMAQRFRMARGKLGTEYETFTWHYLRHFYASCLIYSGASVKTVQMRMGHASPTETLTTYAHLWPGEDERTRTAIDGFLKRGSGEGRDQGGTEVAN